MTSISENTLELQARLLHLPDGAASGLIFIEQFHAANAVDRCLNPRRPYLLSWNRHNRIAVIWRPDCKLWSCPHCAEGRRRQVVARGYHGASKFHQEGRKIGFVTVTSHEKLDAGRSVKIWPAAWKKLHARLKRAVPDTEYLFVPELHTDGRMHAHGLVIDTPTKRWWKDNARACGFGYQDDMQEATDLRVVGYLAKYTGKMLQFSNLPKGTRRFRPSHGWPKLPMLEPSPDVDTIQIDRNKPLAAQIQDWMDDGYDVILEQSKSFWGLLAGHAEE